MFNINSKVTVSKPLLEGFKIHEVEFKGCEKATYNTAKGTFNVLIIKFENEFGTFRETIFEPDAKAAQRTSSSYGENPAKTECITDLFKMLVKAVNPDLSKKIEDGQMPKKANWDQMRDLFVKATEKYIGVKTQIKLDKNGKGESCFPAFFLGINKQGDLYRKSTFIGDHLAFTAKELERHVKFVASKPTTMKKTSEINLDLEDDTSDMSSDGGKELSLDDLGDL